MGKCYIDSVNDKLVLNGSSINFSEFVKYTNGKILSVDGTEIIDGQLLSRLTVSGGKLALDGILVNSLDLGNISANILPSADTMYNLGSTSKKYLRGYFGEVNTSTINLDAGAITYDGTNSVLKLGTSTIATREWVNSSGAFGKNYARISNGTATTLNRTQNTISIPLNTFVKGDSVMSNGTGFIAPQDDIYSVTAQFFSSDALNANITEIGIIMYVNGVEDGRAFVNTGEPSNNKGCNGNFITKLNKNDVITFKMQVWATDTTSALQIPVGSFIANIRN